MAASAITSVVQQFTDGLQFVVNFLAEGGSWDAAGNWAKSDGGPMLDVMIFDIHYPF